MTKTEYTTISQHSLKDFNNELNAYQAHGWCPMQFCTSPEVGTYNENIDSLATRIVYSAILCRVRELTPLEESLEKLILALNQGFEIAPDQKMKNAILDCVNACEEARKLLPLKK